MQDSLSALPTPCKTRIRTEEDVALVDTHGPVPEVAFEARSADGIVMTMLMVAMSLEWAVAMSEYKMHTSSSNKCTLRATYTGWDQTHNLTTLPFVASQSTLLARSYTSA